MASAGHRLLPEQPGFQGDFKSSIQELLQQPAVQHVYLPALDLRAWLLTLSDGQTKLHVYEEELTESNFACDCCRIVGESIGAPEQPLGALWQPCAAPRP